MRRGNGLKMALDISGPTLSYHPLDPSVLDDPYPAYAAMRTLGTPLWNDALDSWVLTSYADCRAVLADHGTFAADFRRAGEVVSEVGLDVHTIDPPEHTAIYTVLADSLRRMVRPELAVRVRAKVESMLDALPPGPVDMITEFTEPLARWFIPTAIGLPQFDLAVIRPLAEDITRAMDSGLVPEAREPGIAAQGRLAALLENWVAELGPTQPLRLLADQAAAAGVPRHVVMNSMRTLVVNGFTAVPASLGNALHALTRRQIRLAEHRGSQALDRAAHEFFRFEAPIQGTTRVCVADTDLAGVRVRPGQGVLMLFAAANRDPAQFADPDRIVLGRWPNPHLSFGYGAHACTGLMLAHLLLRQVLDVLGDRGIMLRPHRPAVRKRLATVRTLGELAVELVR